MASFKSITRFKVTNSAIYSSDYELVEAKKYRKKTLIEQYFFAKFTLSLLPGPMLHMLPIYTETFIKFLKRV